MPTSHHIVSSFFLFSVPFSFLDHYSLKIMSSFTLEPLLHQPLRQPIPKFHPIKSTKISPFSLNFSSRAVKIGGTFFSHRPIKHLSVTSSSATSTLTHDPQSNEVAYSENYELSWIKKVWTLSTHLIFLVFLKWAHFSLWKFQCFFLIWIVGYD